MHVRTPDGIACPHACPKPPPTDLSFVLHAINAQAEVFPIEKGGTQVENVTPTKVDLLDLAAETGVSVECLGISRLAAFYDHEKDRYVLVFSTYAYGPVSNTPPVFLAVSLTNNPLGAWCVAHEPLWSSRCAV